MIEKEIHIFVNFETNGDSDAVNLIRNAIESANREAIRELLVNGVKPMKATKVSVKVSIEESEKM